MNHNRKSTPVRASDLVVWLCAVLLWWAGTTVWGGEHADSAPPVAPEAVRAMNVQTFEVPTARGIRMVRISGGSMVMGSPDDEPGRADDEVPHEVTITRPFYAAETEVTQTQYLSVMAPDFQRMFHLAADWGHSLPELHSGGPFMNPSQHVLEMARHPMEGVTWSNAVAFCETLTARERKAGRIPAGYAYRLPTEAEWEYACRAGSVGPFNTEGAPVTCAVGPDTEQTRPVREDRRPNAWGLYDMHGNVYEWCLDWYGPYGVHAVADPVGPAGGERKVARGGCYLSGKREGSNPHKSPDPRWLRSSARGKFIPDLPLPIVGFRVVLAPEMNTGGR